MTETTAIVALGSNLGHRTDNLRQARELIARLPGTLSLRASSLYETEPVGVPERHRDQTYLNAILVVHTTLDVESWSRLLHSIEDALHRIRTTEANIPRPIDVDLITFGDLTLARPDLTLPHPRAHERRFVLEPLAELLPNLVLPGHTRSVAESLRALPSTPWVRRVGPFPCTPRHRPLPFLPTFNLPELLASGTPLIRIPPGTHTFSEPLLLHSNLRIIAAPNANIIAPALRAIGTPTLHNLSVQGGSWHTPFSLHGIRSLRLSHLALHASLQLTRVSHFSLRHLHITSTEPHALTLGACTRYGSISHINGSATEALIALLPTTEDASGPISHLTFSHIAPSSIFLQPPSKASLFALRPHALLRNRPPPPKRPPSTRLPRAFARLFRPTGLVHCTSPYGPRIHPVTGELHSFHSGIDLVLRSGNQLLESGICAFAEGTVITATDASDAPNSPAGTHVSIAHPGGLTTHYFHLEIGSLRVCQGQPVHRGTLLGYMGKTGRSTGEHLHFQTERNGAIVAPVKTLHCLPS